MLFFISNGRKVEKMYKNFVIIEKLEHSNVNNSLSAISVLIGECILLYIHIYFFLFSVIIIFGSCNINILISVIRISLIFKSI